MHIWRFYYIIGVIICINLAPFIDNRICTPSAEYNKYPNVIATRLDEYAQAYDDLRANDPQMTLAEETWKYYGATDAKDTLISVTGQMIADATSTSTNADVLVLTQGSCIQASSPRKKDAPRIISVRVETPGEVRVATFLETERPYKSFQTVKSVCEAKGVKYMKN